MDGRNRWAEKVRRFPRPYVSQHFPPGGYAAPTNSRLDCRGEQAMTDHLDFYIDGAWVPPATPATRDVINPATEKPIAKISLGSAADVDKAVSLGAARVRELLAHHARGAHRAAAEDRRRVPGEVRRDRRRPSRARWVRRSGCRRPPRPRPVSRTSCRRSRCSRATSSRRSAARRGSSASRSASAD